MTLRPKDFLALGRLAARCVDDKKALDIRLLDVRRLTSVADYFLLASAESHTQLQAVYDHVADEIKKEFGLQLLHREGVGSSHWTILDYGGLVVHLFHRNARQFYDLERLWEGAKLVDSGFETARSTSSRAKSKSAPTHKPKTKKPKKKLSAR